MEVGSNPNLLEDMKTLSSLGRANIPREAVDAAADAIKDGEISGTELSTIASKLTADDISYLQASANMSEETITQLKTASQPAVAVAQKPDGLSFGSGVTPMTSKSADEHGDPVIRLEDGADNGDNLITPEKGKTIVFTAPSYSAWKGGGEVKYKDPATGEMKTGRKITISGTVKVAGTEQKTAVGTTYKIKQVERSFIVPEGQKFTTNFGFGRADKQAPSDMLN